MLALGIILLVLCLLFLGVILFRGELKEWQKERRERRKTMNKLFNKGNQHGK